MIPIRDKRTDISSEVSAGKKLQEKIKKLAEEAANKSVDQHVNLDVVIAEISKRESFNRLQIQRLVEESNTLAYNKRYDKLRNSNDRRITFAVASLDGVVKELGSAAPPEIKNPNLSAGEKGNGEMSKAASSIEPSYLHHPNARLQERHGAYLEKVASVEQQQSEKQQMAHEREHQRTIFKIANSLVMTERQYKNGNEVFNTMLSDATLSDSDIGFITKKASEIGELMVKTKRSHPSFVVTLKQNPQEKIASHLLGEFSLLKEAEENDKVKVVKIQPTSDVADYQQLIDLARRLQNQTMKTPASAGSEV